MKNRRDIVEYILKLEEEFPVNSWKHNDIFLWPYLRIGLFRELIRQVESEKDTNLTHAKENTRPAESKHLIKRIFDKFSSFLQYFFWSCKLKKRNVLFVGADSHRVDQNGKRYNRFFDTLTDLNNLKNNYWFLEYGDTVHANIQTEENVIFLNKQFLIFLGLERIKKLFTLKKDEHIFSLKDYDAFLNKLKQNPLLSRFCLTHSEESLRKNYAIKWSNYYKFYQFLLSKIRPDKILTLCYYDFTVMPLITVANKMGILVVEMQHGPQAELHLAYGNWNKVPDQGYQTMPRLFWCWDKQSKMVIDKWAVSHARYKAIVGGHPWINFWKSKNVTYNHSGFILYSLQPDPLSISQLFPPSLIEFIKNEKYVWFLRLHPRQIEKKEELEHFLLKNEVMDLVNINDATSDPLPQLLNSCLFHVTHFSGSAIEANLFKKYNVFLNQLGEDYYPNFINNNEASFINPYISDFRSKLFEVIEKCQHYPSVNEAGLSKNYSTN